MSTENIIHANLISSLSYKTIIVLETKQINVRKIDSFRIKQKIAAEADEGSGSGLVGTMENGAVQE